MAIIAAEWTESPSYLYLAIGVVLALPMVRIGEAVESRLGRQLMGWAWVVPLAVVGVGVLLENGNLVAAGFGSLVVARAHLFTSGWA